MRTKKWKVSLAKDVRYAQTPLLSEKEINTDWISNSNAMTHAYVLLDTSDRCKHLGLSEAPSRRLIPQNKNVE